MMSATEIGKPNANEGPSAQHSSTANGSSQGPIIEARGLTKRFRKGSDVITALNDVDLTIERGEFIALVGPSGCGKSTMMNMIAGLLEPSMGEMLYDGKPVSGPNTAVGYITQRDNLMPWRSVADNVGIGLEIKRVPKAQRKPMIDKALAMVGLEGFGDALPQQLSGGMRKRAALARTLVYEPQTILADEPFGALDAQLKLLMQIEMLRIWNDQVPRRTVVWVTHDLTEAATLADRVIVFTSRPGEIKLDMKIDLPRPRDVMQIRFTPGFGEIYEELWRALENEMAKGEAAQ
jgi:NitT/TauT family transport system ATP-binding protein